MSLKIFRIYSIPLVNRRQCVLVTVTLLRLLGRERHSFHRFVLHKRSEGLLVVMLNKV